MQWSKVFLLVAVLSHGGGGVTKSKSSGIDEFWTDDYKIFGQIYGKTSDKDIYGARLPAAITFTKRDKIKDASEKNERYLIKDYNDADFNIFDSNSFGNQHNIMSQHLVLSKKPTPSAIDFISFSNFKPISHTTDPETYNYLKHLEDYSKNEYNFPKTSGASQPYLMYGNTKPEETNEFKSVQDIIDAHAANAATTHKIEDDDDLKFLTYSKNKKNGKKPPRFYNEVKPKCIGRMCRNREAIRSRGRPYRRSPPSVKTFVVI